MQTLVQVGENKLGWEDNTERNFTEIFCLDSNNSAWIQTSQICEQGDKPLNSIKYSNFLNVTAVFDFSKEVFHDGVCLLEKSMNQQQM
jgi:hypothetical protein